VVAFYLKPGKQKLNQRTSFYPVAKFVFASRAYCGGCFADSWYCISWIVMNSEFILIKNHSHYFRGIISHKAAQKQYNKTDIYLYKTAIYVKKRTVEVKK